MKRVYKKKDTPEQFKIIFVKPQTKEKLKKLSLKHNMYQYEIIEKAIDLLASQ